jgi:Domain of unknown function (DUF4157)
VLRGASASIKRAGRAPAAAAAGATSREPRDPASAASRLQSLVGNRAIAALAGSAGPETDSPAPGCGQPLDPKLRAGLEHGFGRDLRHVRIHDDAQARRAAASVNAEAFAYGEHVVLDMELQEILRRPDGRRLLAHELAHVLQQRAGGTRAPSLAPGTGSEAEAEAAAAAVAGGGRAPALIGTAPGIARGVRTANIEQVSDEELVAEHDLTQRWLLEHDVSDPAYRETLGYFQRLEQLVMNRSPATRSATPTKASVSSGASSETTAVVSSEASGTSRRGLATGGLTARPLTNDPDEGDSAAIRGRAIATRALGARATPGVQIPPARKAAPPASRPLRDEEIARMTAEQIEQRARYLNNPYRPENAEELLRLASAWESKRTIDSDSTDPLGGLPLVTVFGNLDFLLIDAMAIAQRTHHRHRPKKKGAEVITFPYGEVVTRSKPARPPLTLGPALPEVTEELGSIIEPENPEAVETIIHAGATAAEAIGEESLILGSIALVGDVVALSIKLVNALIENTRMLKSGGKLDGIRATLIAANNLNHRWLLDKVDQRSLVALAEGELKKVTGPPTAFTESGKEYLVAGQIEGIEEAAQLILYALSSVETKYKEHYSRLKETGGEPIVRSGRVALRKAYLDAGFTFEDQPGEIMRLKHAAFDSLYDNTWKTLRMATSRRRYEP